MFDSISTLAVASNMRELYRLVLVDTPLAPYFSSNLTSGPLAPLLTPSACRWDDVHVLPVSTRHEDKYLVSGERAQIKTARSCSKWPLHPRYFGQNETLPHCCRFHPHVQVDDAADDDLPTHKSPSAMVQQIETRLHACLPGTAVWGGPRSPVQLSSSFLIQKKFLTLQRGDTMGKHDGKE